MTQLDAVILGIVQGLTEFLPVSSSAHLVMAEQFLKMSQANVMFDLILHLGTLCALLLVFGKDIVRLVLSLGPPRWYGTNLEQQKRDAKFVGLLILAAIPTGIIGFFFDPIIDRLFSSLLVCGVGLIITGFVLISTKFKKKSGVKVSIWQALIIGTVQGIAVIPGVSRSGSTIAAGILSGVEQSIAARFSLILSIPVVFGAALFHYLHNPQVGTSLGFEAVTGFLLSLLIGYLSLVVLLRIISKGKFYRFAYYCWPVGVFLVIYSVFVL